MRGIISGNVLYADSETFITAVDIHSGKMIWERDDSWAYTPMDMYVCGNVLLKCAGNAIAGYDINTGSILYEYRNYGTWQTSVDKKIAYIVNRKQDIDIIDVQSGEFLTKIVCPYQSNGELFSGSYPVIRRHYLYVMSYRHLFRYKIPKSLHHS